MPDANADARILSGLIEALIGGSALMGMMAVTFFISATLMPSVSRELPQLNGPGGVFAAR